MEETKEMMVTFNATIDARFEDEFAKIIDHKIEALIDLDSYPEIKSIHSANVYSLEDVQSF